MRSTSRNFKELKVKESFLFETTQSTDSEILQIAGTTDSVIFLNKDWRGHNLITTSNLKMKFTYCYKLITHC